MCLKLVSVNAAAQSYHIIFQLERVSFNVPFSVKSASYSMGSDGKEFPIADCDISLTQSLIESQVLKVP
jgi:hypothetical protein